MLWLGASPHFPLPGCPSAKSLDPNYYTHSGRRFHIEEGIPLDQLAAFKSGTKKHQEEQHINVAQGVNLVELVQSLALDMAKRRFGWATD